MKKTVLYVVVLFVFAFIIFTLFNNKAQMEKKARIAPITSYPVSVVKVTRQKINTNLSQVGVIVANNDVAIVAEVSGKITAVYVKEGSYVAAGAPIVKVDDTIPQANFLASKTSFEKAKKDWERKQSLYQQGLISESDFEAARQSYQSSEAQFVVAQRQYQNATITTPIAGIITSRPVNIGMMVNPGTVIANVIDNSLFKVKLNIGEEDAFKIKVGDSVEVETEVFPGAKFYGKVDSISSKGDEAHTFPVQIVIPNSRQYPLKSGMFGKVTFNFSNQMALTIPRDALVGSVKNPQVFIVENGTAQLKDIVIGSENGPNIVVKQGIKEGDTVVISGQDNLRNDIGVIIQN